MRWRLRVERETLRAPALRDKLQAALAELLGAAGAPRGRGRRGRRLAGARATPPNARAARREAEQIIHNDPLVRALMAQYKTARIVPGSVKPH